MIHKTFTVEKKTIDLQAGTYELMASTEGMDRDGDILLADGAELDAFRANPVIPFAHKYDIPPVARANSIEPISGSGLKAVIQFPAKGISLFADEIHGLWDAGFLNAASVGFIPKTWQDIPGADGKTGGRLYTKWEILEVSLVPVPANSGALRLAVDVLDDIESKSGRVISAKTETLLRTASDAILAVLAQLDAAPEEPKQYGELSAVLADLKTFLGGN